MRDGVKLAENIAPSVYNGNLNEWQDFAAETALSSSSVVLEVP